VGQGVTSGPGQLRPEPSAPALEVRHISKSFAGTAALTDADLRVRQGTVHALLGGNGSGKSTMIKCLAGVHTADSGEVKLLGHTWPASGMTPQRAYQAGLRVVHQDLGLFQRMTVAENFALGSSFPSNRAGRIRWRNLRERVGDLLAQYDIDASPDAPVGSLRPASKTMLAVARALQDQQGSEFVLLLDEPTASLPEHESRLLMAALGERAERGQSIVLVSHRMREVRDIAHDFTVFRDGRVAGTVGNRTPSEEELVHLMAGVSISRARVSPASTAPSEPFLEIENLRAGPVRGLNLTVRRGEIVGLAGLNGSGRSTTLSSIFGIQARQSGVVRLAGKVLRPGDVRDAMRQGVALVPQNRLQDAAFPRLTLRNNASVSVLARYWRLWMRGIRERADTDDLVRRFDIRTAGVDTPFSSLSGGNQQKVVLARWLRREPTLLLLDEPTQGVDVVARSDIYLQVREAATAGCAVLIASSDFEELTQLCQRVLILARGRVVETLTSEGLTADRITHAVHTAGHLEEIPA
jgi:ribose transport system ATP-binding protein